MSNNRNENGYDHSLEDIAEACGLTEEQADNISRRLYYADVEADTDSEAVEAFEQDFTKKELAFAVKMLRKNVELLEHQRQILSGDSDAEVIEVNPDQLPAEIKEKILGKIKELAKRRREEDSNEKKPFKFMGKGGEA